MLNDPASIIYSQCLSIDSNNVVINKRSPQGFNSRKPPLYGALRYLPVFIVSRHVSRFGAVLFLVCSQDEVVTSLNKILRLFFFFSFFFFPGRKRGVCCTHAG